MRSLATAMLLAAFSLAPVASADEAAAAPPAAPEPLVLVTIPFRYLDPVVMAEMYGATLLDSSVTDEAGGVVAGVLRAGPAEEGGAADQSQAAVQTGGPQGASPRGGPPLRAIFANPPVSAIVLADRHEIVLRGSRAVVDELRELVKYLDVPSRLVRLTVAVSSASEADLAASGVVWRERSPEAGPAVNYAALAQDAYAKLVAAGVVPVQTELPPVTTPSNATAAWDALVGANQDLHLRAFASPRINADGSVTLWTRLRLDDTRTTPTATAERVAALRLAPDQVVAVGLPPGAEGPGKGVVLFISAVPEAEEPTTQVQLGKEGQVLEVYPLQNIDAGTAVQELGGYIAPGVPAGQGAAGMTGALVQQQQVTQDLQLAYGQADTGRLLGLTLLAPFEAQNLVVVSGPADAVASARERLAQMDRPTPEVLITLTLIAGTPEAQAALGQLLDQPGPAANAGARSATLDAPPEMPEAAVVSRARVMLMLGHEGSVAIVARQKGKGEQPADSGLQLSVSADAREGNLIELRGTVQVPGHQPAPFAGIVRLGGSIVVRLDPQEQAGKPDVAYVVVTPEILDRQQTDTTPQPAATAEP